MYILDSKMLDNRPQVCYSKIICDMTLDPIKEFVIVAACQAIINVPGDNANDMHPLTVDVC